MCFQQLQVPRVRHHCLAEVNGAVDDTLLLVPLQDAGDDGLGRDTVAAVIHHHRAQRVQPLRSTALYVRTPFRSFVGARRPPSPPKSL